MAFSGQIHLPRPAREFYQGPRLHAILKASAWRQGVSVSVVGRCGLVRIARWADDP